MACSKSDGRNLLRAECGHLISQELFCGNYRTQVGLPPERGRKFAERFHSGADQRSAPEESVVVFLKTQYLLSISPHMAVTCHPLPIGGEVIVCEGMPCADVFRWSGSADLHNSNSQHHFFLGKGNVAFHRLSSATGVESIVCAMPEIPKSRGCQEPSQRYLKRVAKTSNDMKLLLRFGERQKRCV